MPVDYYIDSDDSDFSETDMSIRGRKGRTSFHRRSVSRHRRPEAKETLLVPAQQSSRVYRSASMGGRRPRERESTPAVMIVNEQAQRTSNSNSRDNKPRRVHQRATFDADSDEEVVKSSWRRATSGVLREVSPYHRDYELLMGQRLLEKSDFRQDMEIWKQQQEIERLERELAKHRERAEMPLDVRDSRVFREEEEWYEDEISDRLRRLERFERRARTEEERKKAEHQWRLRKFEEAEKEAAGKEELKAKLKEEKLKEIAKAQEEAEEIAKLKAQIIAEEKQKAIEEEEKKQQEIEMKKAAVEEWKVEQERIKLKEKEEQEQKDKEYRERLRQDFGYTEEEIEEKLKKKDEKEKGKYKALEETSSTTWIKVCDPLIARSSDLMLSRFIANTFCPRHWAHIIFPGTGTM